MVFSQQWYLVLNFRNEDISKADVKKPSKSTKDSRTDPQRTEDKQTDEVVTENVLDVWPPCREPHAWRQPELIEGKGTNRTRAFHTRALPYRAEGKVQYHLPPFICWSV